MEFRQGDRVRIKNLVSEYTGCRGTIVIDADDQPDDVVPLGHYVAIDGENGRTRPFLVSDLEPIRVARVRPSPPRPGQTVSVSEANAPSGPRSSRRASSPPPSADPSPRQRGD